jgi:hypothetical protein
MRKMIAIKVKKRARHGWEALFKLMRARGEDWLLIPDTLDPLPARRLKSPRPQASSGIKQKTP